MATTTREVWALLDVWDYAFLSNLVSSVDHGFLGLVLLCQPDILSWQDASQDDPVVNTLSTEFTTLSLMGTGTTLLTVLLYHLFYLQNAQDERLLLRLKLVNYLSQVLLLLQSRTVVGAERFYENWFATARLGISSFLAVWLVMSLWRSSSMYGFQSNNSTNETKQQRKIHKSVEMAVLLEFAYYLSIAYVAGMAIFSSSTATFDSPTTDTTSTLVWWQTNHILLALSWQVAHFVALLGLMLGTVDQVPNADAKLLQIQNLLFLGVLVASLYGMEFPTMAERCAVQLFCGLHSIVTLLVFQMSSSSSSTSLAPETVSPRQEQLTKDLTMNHVGDEPCLVKDENDEDMTTNRAPPTVLDKTKVA